MEEENQKYLDSNSKIKIMYVNPLNIAAEDRLLEKGHSTNFEYFLDNFEFDNIGKKIPVSELERQLSDCFDAYQDVNARRCYGMEAFNNSLDTEDYLMVKKLGDTDEKKVWKELAEDNPKMKANMPPMFKDNVFTYLRYDIGQSRIAIGFFEYDAKAEHSKILNKKDYAIVGFIQNFK